MSVNISSAEASESTYKVNSGDTLWKISLANNTTVANLKKWNNLTSDNLNIGQSLYISKPSTGEVNVTSHTVKSGDTLFLISKRYGISVDSLKSLNNLNSDMILVGQVLKIKGTANAINTNEFTYIVKSGDTLYKISQSYNTTVSALKSRNGLVSDNLNVGQKLIIGQVNVVDKSILIENVINEGYKYIGTPYVWGGTSPAGFDCSGFLFYIYQEQGITIPRTVETLWNWEKSIPTSELKRGDIVYFETYKAGPSHSGIYLGNGEFMHASSSAGVTVSKMNNVYYKERYLGAKRVVLN